MICGPVGPASTWAATSNVKVGQTPCPVNMGRVGMEGSERKVTKKRRGKEKVGWEKVPWLRRRGCTWNFVLGSPSS